MNKWYLLAILSISCCSPVIGAPSISSVTAPDNAGIYNKFEVTFNISTEATHLYWPYDPTPSANTVEHPNAVPAGVGVSVDGLFLKPGDSDWDNALVQPGFIYQDFQLDPANPSRTLQNGNPWIYPVGSPVWKLRFSPSSLGQWRYKIRVMDSSGSTTSPEYGFDCTQSNSHGFVHVSPNDARYFELSDGTFQEFLAGNNLTPANAKELGINLTRYWWQSSNPSRALFGAGGQGGDLVWSHLTYDSANAPAGYLTCSTVPQNAAVYNSINAIVAVKPGSSYRFKAKVKLDALAGTGDCGLYLACMNGNVKSERIIGTADWNWVNLDVTVPANAYEIRPWVGTQNTTSGTVYISDISLRENINGSYGPELLGRTELQPHVSYHQAIAWNIDKDLEEAKQLGIYIKVVTEEKGDSYFGRIQADGSWGAFSNDNVYGSETHACRVFQTYYWRYLIARYGYSANIHSFELFNEADPFSSMHWDIVQAFGNFVKSNDPNKHMVSTSNWHSFPPLNWKQCTAADYADLHMYMGWDVPSNGNRVFPGWDGPWFAPTWIDLTMSSPVYKYEIDNTTKHSGSNSLKLTLFPATAETLVYMPMGFVCGAPPGHKIKVSAWLKGQNLIGFSGNAQSVLLDGLYKMNGEDWCGWPLYDGHPNVGLGWRTGTSGNPVSYDWEYTEVTFIVPTTKLAGDWVGVPQSVYFRLRARPNNSDQNGYAWIDDLVVEDLTTHKILNYNGNFEEITPESYDVVADHCSYAKLAASFQFNKPTTRGETGICYTQRYADPYKGYSKNEEDEALVDDADHLWWKKLVWSQMYCDKLYDVPWWSRNIGGPYGNSYLAFMADIPLSNGNYEDLSATASDVRIRVLGQKDLTNNRAHLWIDNAPYTWKAVVDHNYSPEAWSSTATYALDSTCGGGSSVHIYKSIQNNNKNHPVTDTVWWQDLGAFNAANNPQLPSPVSGTVTVGGFKSSLYLIRWFDTSSGNTVKDEYYQCNDGSISLVVQNMQSDIACKIMPAPGRIKVTIDSSTRDVLPGQPVTVTVSYTNDTDNTCSNARISVNVPPELEYVEGSASGSDGSYDSATRKISWYVGTLGPHDTGTRTYVGRIK